MKIKQIKSKATQTKVFNSVMEAVNKAIEPFEDYRTQERKLGNTREILIVSKMYYHTIYRYALMSILNTVEPFCDKYSNVYPSINTCTILDESYNEKIVPCVTISVGLEIPSNNNH